MQRTRDTLEKRARRGEKRIESSKDVRAVAVDCFDSVKGCLHAFADRRRVSFKSTSPTPCFLADTSMVLNAGGVLDLLGQFTLAVANHAHVFLALKALLHFEVFMGVSGGQVPVVKV